MEHAGEHRAGNCPQDGVGLALPPGNASLKLLRHVVPVLNENSSKSQRKVENGALAAQKAEDSGFYFFQVRHSAPEAK
jgi:hypothetical protein